MPSVAQPQRGRVNRMQAARYGAKFLRPLVKQWELQGYAVTGLVKRTVSRAGLIVKANASEAQQKEGKDSTKVQ